MKYSPLKNAKFCTKKENAGRNNLVEIARFGCRVSIESAFDVVGLGCCYYNYQGAGNCGRLKGLDVDRELGELVRHQM
jgi:hypothetical protein